MLETILKLISTPVYAQTTEPRRLSEMFTSIDKIVDWIFPIGIAIALAMVIYGGYMWIISGGDPSRKQEAQGTLTWSMIGLIFLFLIRAILEAIVGFLIS